VLAHPFVFPTLMLMIFLNPRGAGLDLPGFFGPMISRKMAQTLVVLPTLYRWFDEKPAEA
jgi:hypothetical protein